MKDTLVLFDGYCVLCSGFARWLQKKFRGSVELIAMQSAKGHAVLNDYGFGRDVMDEVVVISNKDVMGGASAILFILGMTGRWGEFWRRVLMLFPSSFIKWGYRVVAKNRYKWFGKRGSCTIIQD
jgi:predicted DCC family thiol-disulfide oxidoreductase YuxK